MGGWGSGFRATLNWQAFDCDVRTNLAFFRDNGACGYVLKPEWLRNPTIGPVQ